MAARAEGMWHRRTGLVLALVGVLLLLPLLPAWAQTTESRGGLLVTEGPVEVPEGARLDALFVNGDATIAGQVETVIAYNGDVTVTGRAGGMVTAVNGTVILEPGASVEGDVYASQAPQVAEGATVGGTVQTVNFTQLFFDIQRGLGFLVWIATTIGLLLLGLLMVVLTPRGVEAAHRVARTEVGLAVATGALLVVGLPLLGVLIGLTLVGLPIAFALFAALWLFGAAGTVISGRAIGGLLLRGNNQALLATLIGIGLLQLVALIPFLGGLVVTLAGAYGLGAMAVAAYRAGQFARPEAEPASAPRSPVATPQS